MYRFASSSAQKTLRSQTPLSNEQIAHYAPSVTALAPHDRVSERYTHIPTIKVIDGLRDAGFYPFEVRQTLVRDPSRREHTKHLVRLRHHSAIESTGKGEVGEIVLLNSHDGSSSYQLLSGFFRFVCSNGLIAGDITNDVRVRHSGNVVDNVIEGATRILSDLEVAQSRVGDYKSLSLTHDEQRLFANVALGLRWEPESAPVTVENVLRPSRWADAGSDLWTTFNVVQENLIKGGVSGRAKTGRRLTTKAVSGVSENVRLNQSLWALADGFAKLKQNAVEVEELVAA
jgi:hypothetical protein